MKPMANSDDVQDLDGAKRPPAENDTAASTPRLEHMPSRHLIVRGNASSPKAQPVLIAAPPHAHTDLVRSLSTFRIHQTGM